MEFQPPLNGLSPSILNSFIRRVQKHTGLQGFVVVKTRTKPTCLKWFENERKGRVILASSVVRARFPWIFPVVALLRAQKYMVGVGHILAVYPQALLLCLTSNSNFCPYHPITCRIECPYLFCDSASCA